MATNNQIADKINTILLPEVTVTGKFNAVTEFNVMKNFQNSPVQQFTTFTDTSIVIDGTKNYSTTLVVTGATRTITAAASGHQQGNSIKARYQFDIDCTITLSNFDIAGNNTGIITPILAGTYDFIFSSNANGINLEILQNINIWIRNGDDIFFNTGNVGIGTIIPNVKLHVSGSEASIRIESTDLENPALHIQDSSKAYQIYIDQDTLFFRDSTLAVNRISIDPAGNVGIGTNTPTEKFDVNGNAIFRGQVGVSGKDEAFASALEFDCDNGNMQRVLVTSNITSITVINAKPSHTYRFYLIQDAGGGNTIPTPNPATFGTATDNSVTDFITTGDGRNIIDLTVDPDDFREYSLETHTI